MYRPLDVLSKANVFTLRIENPFMGVSAIFEAEISQKFVSASPLSHYTQLSEC